MYIKRIERIFQFNDAGEVLSDIWMYHISDEEGQNLCTDVGFNDFNHCLQEANKEIDRLRLFDATYKNY